MHKNTHLHALGFGVLAACEGKTRLFRFCAANTLIAVTLLCDIGGERPNKQAIKGRNAKQYKNKYCAKSNADHIVHYHIQSK